MASSAGRVRKAPLELGWGGDRMSASCLFLLPCAGTGALLALGSLDLWLICRLLEAEVTRCGSGGGSPVLKS